MTITPLGKIPVPTPGTPVPLSVNPSLTVHRIIISQVPGTTGKVYLKNIRTPSTPAIVRVFLPAGASGFTDEHIITTGGQTNVLKPAEWALDADFANEGAYIYWEQA